MTEAIENSNGPRVIASAKMTKDQVEMSVVKTLIEQNEDLSTEIDGKSVKIVTQWQTQKGSDPDYLVHVHFVQDESVSAEPVEDNISED